MFFFKEFINVEEKSFGKQNCTENTDSKLSNSKIWDNIYYNR